MDNLVAAAAKMLARIKKQLWSDPPQTIKGKTGDYIVGTENLRALGPVREQRYYGNTDTLNGGSGLRQRMPCDEVLSSY